MSRLFESVRLGDDRHEIEFTVQEASIDGSDKTQVMVEVKARNNGDDRPADNSDNYYFNYGAMDGLLVDGVSFDVFCFGPVTGVQTLEHGESAIAWIGFRTAGVATGAELILELDPDGAVDIGTSP